MKAKKHNCVFYGPKSADILTNAELQKEHECHEDGTVVFDWLPGRCFNIVSKRHGKHHVVTLVETT